MRHLQRSTLARLGLMALILIVVASACSLGGGDDTGADAQPTVPATITPPFTKTPIPSFTPFLTSTPVSGGFQVVPSATPISVWPTQQPVYTPFPTWTPAQASATSYPYDVRISYPVDGSQIAGYLTIIGSASHPRFLQYALEWGPDPNPGNLWYPITSPRTTPVINGALGAVNTHLRQDGNYQIRLHIWLNDGTETFDYATGIRVSNKAPTAVPTATSTPRPNRAPLIQPIPSQQVDAGNTITLTVTTSDPDGDFVNIFAASSNNAIGTVQVLSPTQISVTGSTAGIATITVTANDNNGGLASTAFIVTVSGQNQAPTIGTILNQAVDVGQTFNLPVSASDPDGDTLTLTASSSDTAIVTVNAPDNSSVNLTGVAVGTATVTVTASDGKGGIVNTAFQVEVGQPNRPPVIDTIPAQTMSVGDTIPVTYTASDPDGDQITADAVSDTLGVVVATLTQPGTIQLQAVSAGTATVTLTVDDTDATTNPAITTFQVTVAQGNQPPTIDGIGPQTMNVNETKDVPYNASDPDNDTLTPSVESDNQGVVTAAINGSAITLNAVSAGTATITLTVTDNNNPAVSMAFTVSVANVNLPPTIGQIGQQTLGVGNVVDVPYSASDPENDPLTPSVVSDNQGVVTAALNNNAITLTAVGAGSATITLTVTDNTNPAVNMPFTVTVTQNTPPTVDGILDQSMNVGDTLPVGYNAFDAEDPINATVASDNGGVVTAAINNPGTITLTAVDAGSATVTLTVTDNVNAPVATTFTVNVAATNQNPIIQPITQQAVNVTQTITVPVSASDPDGDPVTLTAASDNPAIASAVQNGNAQIDVTGVAPGQANVNLQVEDGKGGVATASFVVVVQGINNPPVIQPINDQTVETGQQIPVSIVVTDADGNGVVVTALSQNNGIAIAEAMGTDTILLTGVAEGVVAVEVTADDAQGGLTTTMFNVSVTAAQPSFDLMQYPVIPTINQAMAQTLQQLYQSGVANFGNQAGAFSKVGASVLDNPNFMTPFNNQYNLGNYGSLETTINFYKFTQVRAGTDPLTNSFNVDSGAVVAQQDFGIDLLTSTVTPDEQCKAINAPSSLACEYTLTKPSIALISFNAANVIYMDPSAFRSELQSIIQQTLQNYGVIPVLATIPADGVATSEQLLPYNQAIVEVAQQSGIAGIPLWNLWRAMQERGITDPTTVAPAGAGDLTDASLGYGYNIRNLTALQVLDAVRAGVGIN
ncbi:MAG: hypothetical protein JXA10_08735 [Anaerolineae bacterium]|nr:hypothetical protein [Anaerolineae bacterium]